MIVKRPFKFMNGHRCPYKCKMCKSYLGCSEKSEFVYCDDCNLPFFGVACYEEHKRVKEGKTVVCDLIQRCSNCNLVLNMSKHRCGKKRCRICSIMVGKGHKCYIPFLLGRGGPCQYNKSLKTREFCKCKFCKRLNEKYIFYDFEVHEDENREFVVNRAVLYDFCGNREVH